MKKYYTRVCNFYFGSKSIQLVAKKKTLPLNGNNEISFDQIEIISRNSKKLINIKDIGKLSIFLKKKINNDIKIIIKKNKNFSNLNFRKVPNIMGVLNLTPDSFSDGGKFNKKNKALKQIKLMIKNGADIIDIGGESTRPGSITVNSFNEWKRIANIVRNFKKKFSTTVLSIDTRKSAVMKKAMDYKTDIINDVSSFNYDKKTIEVIGDRNVFKIIHHMQGTPKTMQIKPKYKNVLLDIYDFFEDKINNQLKGKKYKNKIILDPGIGFGKNLKHNLMLMNKISLFHSLGFPILIGTSRKRFISQISGKFDTNERLGGTLSSVLSTLSQGVQIFRVHDVNEVKQSILVFKKILSNLQN